MTDGNENIEIANQWHNLMTEMYGDSKSLKDDLIKVAMADNRISKSAVDWLNNLSK